MPLSFFSFLRFLLPEKRSASFSFRDFARLLTGGIITRASFSAVARPPHITERFLRLKCLPNRMLDAGNTILAPLKSPRRQE